MLKLKANWLLAFVVLLAVSCQKDIKSGSLSRVNQSNSVVCGTPVQKTLVDWGGVYTIGKVTLSNDGTNISITIDAEAGSHITRVSYVAGSHDYVEDKMGSNIYYTACQGIPSPDQLLTYTVADAKTSVTITLPASKFEADGCVWLGLLVSSVTASGTTLCGGVDAFNEQFGSAGYQSGFTYCRQDCPPPPDCGQLRTQTPGGWGAPANGNNPGAYLTQNFEDAFGEISVGCAGGFSLKLTTAQAIINLLPTGGKAAVLTNNYQDPASLANVLVGHLVALTLSVGFDNYDAGFGAAGTHLGEMVIGSGTFKDWTVSAFLMEANNVLGGCSSAYTVTQVLETATAINENYVDGKVNKGYLVCPE